MHRHRIADASLSMTSDDPEVLHAWLRQGGSLHDQDTRGASLGHRFGSAGCPRLLAAWCTAGGDPMSRMTDGQTIGHAIMDSEMGVDMVRACMQCWIDAGGDIHAVDNLGQSIGHHAVSVGNHDGLVQWIRHGGRVNATTIDGRTIGHHIVTSHRCLYVSEQSMQTWIASGGDVHAVDHEGLAIGPMAARSGLDCLIPWIIAGGNIHADGTSIPLVTLHQTLQPLRGHHPCIDVTLASLFMMQNRRVSPLFTDAFRIPSGRDLGRRMISSFHDPVDMAIWIQAMEGSS
jgi:hypothetical protein